MYSDILVHASVFIYNNAIAIIVILTVIVFLNEIRKNAVKARKRRWMEAESRRRATISWNTHDKL